MPTTQPRRARTALAIAALVIAGATLAASPILGAEGAARAGGTLRDASGNEIGFVRIVEDGAGGVHVNVKVSGLTPGLHGTHLHALGACTHTATTTFGGAGVHHNPLGKQHGSLNPAGAHAGDLPNLVVNEDRQGTLNVHLDGFTLTPGPTQLLDPDGAALIVHAAPDDYRTDATGNSGGRVACAVVTAD